MSDHKPTYPVLNRAEFLIERACVPKYVPSYPAEIAQILAAIELRQSQQQPSGGGKDVSR